MQHLSLPPRYIQQCIFISCICLALSVLAQVFFVFFLFTITMTFFNSVWMFMEEKRYSKRGILRYVNGSTAKKRGGV